MKYQFKHHVYSNIASLLPILLLTASHYGRQSSVGYRRPEPSNNHAWPVLVCLRTGRWCPPNGARGIVIHAARRVVRGSIRFIHMRGAHYGRSQVHRRLLLLRRRTLGARRARGLPPSPLGSRTVDPATGPAPVVEEPEHGRDTPRFANASARLREDDGHSQVRSWPLRKLSPGNACAKLVVTR